jgi:hypothetical protein
VPGATHAKPRRKPGIWPKHINSSPAAYLAGTRPTSPVSTCQFGVTTGNSARDIDASTPWLTTTIVQPLTGLARESRHRHTSFFNRAPRPLGFIFDITEPLRSSICRIGSIPVVNHPHPHSPISPPLADREPPPRLPGPSGGSLRPGVPPGGRGEPALPEVGEEDSSQRNMLSRRRMRVEWRTATVVIL